jgi:hypothetical protein
MSDYNKSIDQIDQKYIKDTIKSFLNSHVKRKNIVKTIEYLFPILLNNEILFASPKYYDRLLSYEYSKYNRYDQVIEILEQTVNQLATEFDNSVSILNQPNIADNIIISNLVYDSVGFKFDIITEEITAILYCSHEHEF